MARKLTERGLKKWLDGFDLEEMKDLVVELYKVDPTIKERMNVLVLGEEYIKQLFEKRRKLLDKAFSWNKWSLKEAKNVLQNFRTECPDDRWYGEMALYFVELGVYDVVEFGNTYDPLYRAIEKAFCEVARIADKDKEIYELWKNRLDQIVYHTKNEEITDLLLDDYMSIAWVVDELPERLE